MRNGSYRNVEQKYTMIFILLFSITAILFGCKKQEPNITPSTAEVTPYSEPGWTFYKKSKEGYGIALPSRWRLLNGNPKELESSIKAVTQDPAAITSLKEFAQNRFEAGINMVALDSGGTALLQISWRTSDKSDVSLDSIATMWINGMKNSGQQLIGPLSHRHVTTPMGEAQEIKYVTQESATTQYMTNHEKDYYIVTLGTNPDKISAYDSLFTKIGHSFQPVR